MVHVYNCHPFASQQIVQAEQEPGLLCCGGGALFVVASGGCKVEVYRLDQDGCPLLCRFATMGTVKTIQHSTIGDYLVTIEEKNSATYLRAYTNWRYQAEEKSRVGVRLLGHLLRGASQRGGAQMEIIEIPLWEGPVAVACCRVTGDLLVGCANTLVLFNLKRQNSQGQQNPQSPGQNTQQNQNPGPGQSSVHNVSILDFERSVILHLPGFTPHQVALCAGFIAVQSELEVLVLKLDTTPDPTNQEGHEDTQHPANTTTTPPDHVDEPSDFLVLPRHQELLGNQARDCGLSVSLEKTGLEDKRQHTLSYVLYRRFAPDFFQGCTVEETKLHSLQLHPLFTSSQRVSVGEPSCVFCFFSLPTTGYLYSLRGGVELLSAYQYPEKALEAVLTDHFLHVITKGALQCFSVRCSAVATRADDPYIDTTMKACPPSTLEVCALRIQLFIGLRSLGVDGRHVVLLSTADTHTPEEMERNAACRTTSRRWAGSRPRETSPVGHGWNLYVVETVSPLALYHEMVEYSRRYEECSRQTQACRHLLSEAHLLLRASLLQPLHDGLGSPTEMDGRQEGRQEGQTDGRQGGQTDGRQGGQTDGRQEGQTDGRQEGQTDGRQGGQTDGRQGGQTDGRQGGQTDGRQGGQTDGQTERQDLEEAFRESCAQLGDSFSRSTQKDCHLALPYYRMSELSVTDVIIRNRPLPSTPFSYGPGFLFYLKHFLLEETDQVLSKEVADEVIGVFSQSEPSQLVSVCASPGMVLVNPALALLRLQNLEDSLGVSVPLTITMATMALRLGDLQQLEQLMDRHTEMLLVYGLLEEPRLLLQGPALSQPTPLCAHLSLGRPGLVLAAMVALHENHRLTLEQADHVFKELGCEDGLLVDFWEAVLMASSQEAVIQELLFRLAAVYIDRLTHTQTDSSQAPPPSKSLKTADDLISSCSHYGALFPWLSVLTPNTSTNTGHQEALRKLQSLLCGPSLSVCSAVPLLERVSDASLWGLSLQVLCATRRGQHESSIERLLDRCPQAIIPYANHQLQGANMALWWQKLLPELCDRTRTTTANSILLAALKETLVVVATEMSPAEFLMLLPDDGAAVYFLPHLLACCQTHLVH